MRVRVRFQGRAAHSVEHGLRFALTTKPLHQIHARERHVKLVAARVFEQHVIALRVALRDLADAEKLTDPVLHVHNVIAGFQVELIRRKSSEMRLPRFGDRIRRFEKIFGAENADFTFPGEHGAARHLAADQRDSGIHRLCALLQILGHFLAAEVDLVRNRIFAEDVCETLDFAGGRARRKPAGRRIPVAFSPPGWPPAGCRETPSTAWSEYKNCSRLPASRRPRGRVAASREFFRSAAGSAELLPVEEG